MFEWGYRAVTLCEPLSPLLSVKCLLLKAYHSSESTSRWVEKALQSLTGQLYSGRNSGRERVVSTVSSGQSTMEWAAGRGWFLSPVGSRLWNELHKSFPLLVRIYQRLSVGYGPLPPKKEGRGIPDHIWEDNYCFKFTVTPHKIQPNLRFTEMGALAEVLCNVNTEPTPPPPAAAVTSQPPPATEDKDGIESPCHKNNLSSKTFGEAGWWHRL